MMTKHTRIAALILALIVTLMILLSAASTAAEAGHDCSGAECPICMIVTAIHNLVKCAVSAAAIFIIMYIFTRVSAGKTPFTAAVIGDTPVAKKEKLLN